MTNIRRALQAAAGVGGATGDIAGMAFGNNTEGQLGLGNTTNYSSPVMIGFRNTWSKVGAGRQATIAVKADGTLWTWGWNNRGQQGDGTTTSRSDPAQVGALTDWVKPVMGFETSACTKTDGTLWTWGYNGTGQLGLSDTDYRSSPTQVGSLTDWSLAAFGDYHGMAVKTDGTLWAYGNGYWGNLGQGSQSTFSSPVQVGVLTTWLVADGGYGFTVAVKTDGTIWATGKNNFGQLGRDTTSAKETSLAQIGALTTWSKVACIYGSTAAIKTDGTLWAWGRSNDGQTGQGDTVTRSSPVQIGALTDWSKLGSSGRGCFLAIKTDGTLWAWGNNESGELGDGTQIKRSSPVQVGALTTWLEVSSGFNATIALEES